MLNTLWYIAKINIHIQRFTQESELKLNRNHLRAWIDYLHVNMINWGTSVLLMLNYLYHDLSEILFKLWHQETLDHNMIDFWLMLKASFKKLKGSFFPFDRKNNIKHCLCIYVRVWEQEQRRCACFAVYKPVWDQHEFTPWTCFCSLFWFFLLTIYSIFPSSSLTSQPIPPFLRCWCTYKHK